jgi:hypothetical protein
MSLEKYIQEVLDISPLVQHTVERSPHQACIKPASSPISILAQHAQQPEHHLLVIVSSRDHFLSLLSLLSSQHLQYGRSFSCSVDD